jgi:hypothetical protein
MNRDGMGKALHKYLAESTLLPASKAQKSWSRLKEETREEYRKVGVGLAQDFLYGGKYELSLAPLNADQIIYNGLFSCVLPHRQNGWCHLLLIRSKNRDTDDEEQVQKMAIVTQTPGSLLPIQRQIEHIATWIMKFFSNSFFNHPRDDISITPDNTEFVEYIPYSALYDITDITDETYKQQGLVGRSHISIVRFQWEGEKGNDLERYVHLDGQCADPTPLDTTLSAHRIRKR